MDNGGGKTGENKQGERSMEETKVTFLQAIGWLLMLIGFFCGGFLFLIAPGYQAIHASKVMKRRLRK